MRLEGGKEQAEGNQQAEVDQANVVHTADESAALPPLTDTKTGLLRNPIITIQRAWRTYISPMKATTAKPVVQHRSAVAQSSISSDFEESSETDSCSGIQAMSISSPDEEDDLEIEDDHLTNEHYGFQIPEAESSCVTIEMAPSSRLKVDSDNESVVSDYSEMADAVKEHLASIQIIRQDCADANGMSVFSVEPKVLRRSDESTSDCVRRLRKTNCMSLAQEFAALKRVNSDALPFDLHKSEYQNLDESSDDDESGNSESEEGWNDSENLPTPKCEERLMPFPFFPNPSQASLEVESNSFQNAANHVDDVRYQRNQSKSVPSCQNNTNTTSDEFKHFNTFDLLSALDDDPPSVDFIQSAASENVENVPDIVRDLCGDDDEYLNYGSSDLSLAPAVAGSDIFLNTGNQAIVTDSFQVSGICSDAVVEANDSDSMDTNLPVIYWNVLEEELRKSAEENQRTWCGRGDRDEIRWKLAMLEEDDDITGASLHPCRSSTAGLQMCFMNEAADDLDSEAETFDEPTSKPDLIPLRGTSSAKSEDNSSNRPAVRFVCDDENDDMLAAQEKLQLTATIALAEMAALSDLLHHLDSPYYLENTSVGQLQVIVNGMLSQIEALNIELMQRLVERENLHMIQDSMLVDIEDLTRRAREYTARVEKRKSASSRRSAE